ncbi:MAG: LON peptidase substrate-binding domain-containing protein [Deltaproteobacteria bacterium]|jgi:Lon protease-like protein|nr:LON peptidase substrate-binding domain-containing protein [Deltaproteobacteria bacterium]MBW2532446.1 LON peptidase substrate-binding domain-containing protein [Deltaproteobacteria bacterium]
MRELQLHELPIFPLDSAVLIPGGVLPLHVFEPRYRRMVSDSLESDAMLAIALLTGVDQRESIGEPGVSPVVGVGKIHTHQQLADGRYLLLLHGWLRARIEEELETDKPYRLVRATPIVDELGEASSTVDRAAQALRQMVLQLAQRSTSEPAKMLAAACATEADPGRLADLVGAALLDQPEQRQVFLSEPKVWRRLEVLTDTAARALASAAGASSTTLH